MLTQEQKKLRLGRIGSSQIAATAGVPSFSSPITVFREATDAEFERSPDEMMEIGTLLEPVVLELYRRRTGRSALAGKLVLNESEGVLVSKRWPFAVASPDGFSRVSTAAEFDRVVEAKTCLGFRAEEWGEAGTDQVPAAYLCQTQWQMGLAREAGFPITSADVPVLIGGFDFRVYSVQFDQGLFDGLLAAAEKFWRDHIATKTPPPPDATPAYEQFLRFTHPAERAPLRKVGADDEHARAAMELCRAQAAKKKAEAEVQAHRNRLMALVGDAEGIEGPGFRVTWKATTTGSRVLRTKFQGDEA